MVFGRSTCVSLLFALLAASSSDVVYADSPTYSPIKVGVATALTGDAAAFGHDIKNALSLANEVIGGGKYELIFEDEQCDNTTAVSVAQKFINLHKVSAVLGFPCNATLLATAPLYERAQTLVVSSSGNSGDVVDIGKFIIRLFPSDGLGSELLFDFIKPKHSRIAIFTEQNEYPVMVERTFRAANQRSNGPLELLSYDFVHGDTDLRSVVGKAKAKGAQAIFVNANTDASFITLVKQIRAQQFAGPLYALYLPSSEVVRKELGDKVNGFIFANLPLPEDLTTNSGAQLLSQFKARFGNPQSGFPVVPISFEAFRVFDEAVRSGKKWNEYLTDRSFTGGYIPDYRIDAEGAVQGIAFEMQTIVGGKVVRMEPSRGDTPSH